MKRERDRDGDAAVLSRVPTEWDRLPGNSLPEGHRLWGTRAYLLRREEDPLFEAPPGRPFWSEPNGAFKHLHIQEEHQDTVLRLWESFHPGAAVTIESVWETPRPLNQYRVRLSNGLWLDGSWLRCFQAMTGWDRVCVPSRRNDLSFILLTRGDVLVGAFGQVRYETTINPSRCGWKRLT